MPKYTTILVMIVIGGMVFFNLAPFTFASSVERPRQTRVERGGGLDTTLRVKGLRQDQALRYRSDEIIVKGKGDKKFRRVRVQQNETVHDALARYRNRTDIAYAEPNYIAYAYFVPNDPYYSYQWHLDNPVSGGVDAEVAWNESTGSGVVVAVVDTGIAYEDYQESRRRKYYLAPDLADTSFVEGYDFVNNDTHPNDDEGHGTHVAGTIAQSTNNGIGVAGLAFEASLMPVKVLNRYGSGSYADVADGIRFAADNGADVINLSLGGPSPASYLEDAVAYAYNKGVTIVAAAGNDGTNDVGYPAGYDNYVIAVGATRFGETLSYYSNYGSSVDVVAPGGDVTVDQNGDGYGDGVLQQTFGSRTNDWGYYFYQGTSMATPHVVAVAALVKSKGNATTPDEIREAIESTAKDLGSPGRDNTYGHGLVNAYTALGWSAGPVDNPPSVSIMSPGNGSTVLGTVVSISADASDDQGITKVDFYVDGSLIGTDTTNQYEVLWDSTTVSDGSHTISAQAFDTISQTSQDEVSVTVDNINDPPLADAGPDQTVGDADDNGFETITLDGTASFDPDGTIVTYEWKEGLTVLGTSTSLSVDFAVGTHTGTLTVTDNDGATSNDSVTITINPFVNQPPVANAGADQSVVVNQEVFFDGSASSDPDGYITSYEWDFGDGGNVSGTSTTHIYSSAGSYIVTLTVTDDGGLSNEDTASVSVSEASQEEVVFFDSFEAEVWNGLWTEDKQNDWFISGQRATEGENSAEVDGRASDATLTSISIDLLGRSNAAISFDWLIERKLDGGEYLAFDVSTNGGASWQEYARLRGNVDEENTWYTMNFDLTGINNLQLRFRASMSRSNEDSNVDLVQVVAW